MTKKNKTPRHPRIILSKGEDRTIRAGHPWVFANMIETTRGHMPHATIVEVLDHDNAHVGHGLYSASSQIRVRMLSPGLPVPAPPESLLDAAFFAHVLGLCHARRVMLGLANASPATCDESSYRLVNSEGDGIPGLLIDVLAGMVVVQITTAPIHRSRDAVFEALASMFPEHGLLDIPAPANIMELEGFLVERTWRSDVHPERLELHEGEVRFEVLTDEFQKTGHYADMRPHREWVGRMARGKRVLDAYSYTGGFGLHAASQGATEVVCVDSSASVVSRVEVNAKLNGFEQVKAVTSKIEAFLSDAKEQGQRFDITVLDPPKLAPNRRTAHRAIKVYESLCMHAIEVTEPGGLLCITSCSEAIGEKELLKVLGSCVSELGRSLFVSYVGAQAPDHPWPAAMREGHYATFIAVFVG